MTKEGKWPGSSRWPELGGPPGPSQPRRSPEHKPLPPSTTPSAGRSRSPTWRNTRGSDLRAPGLAAAAPAACSRGGNTEPHAAQGLVTTGERKFQKRGNSEESTSRGWG